MRVLPQINDYLNEDWITDKVRFSYDGIKRQRVLKIFVKTKLLQHTKVSEMVNVSPQKMLKIFAEQFYELIRQEKVLKVQSLLGKTLDLETLYSLKSFLSNWSNNADYLFEGLSSTVNPDFRRNYLAPELLTSLENINYLVLTGVNLRVEFPILNIKIRRLVKSKNLVVLNIGHNFSSNFPLINLGNTFKVILSMLQGKHILSKLFFKSSVLDVMRFSIVE